MKALLAIELGQAGVQDVEAIKLLEDRLHQLDGDVLLLLVAGHGGEGLRVCGGWRIRVLEEVAWKDLAAAWDYMRRKRSSDPTQRQCVIESDLAN